MNLPTLQILEQTVKNYLLSDVSACQDVMNLDTEAPFHLVQCLENLL